MNELIEKILVIDDSEEDQITYERYLAHTQNTPVEIIKKRKGNDALTFLTDNTVQCILLDYQLPDMSGIAFMEQALASGLLKAPVIMLTGHGNEKIAVAALKMGAYDYLLKNDLHPEQLHKAITNAIEKSLLLNRIRKQEEEMRFLAYHDHLTNIPNRRQFESLASKAISRAHRTGKHVGIMIIDIDHFKNVNDTLGHEAGDTLLQEISYQLLSSLRKNDTEYLIIQNAAIEALKKEQFYLVYQPIINIQDNTFYGFETLLRWNNPKLQKFSPVQLIPIVEDSGFIIPLGHWILETAFMEFAKIPSHEKMNLTINLSPKQLLDPHFVSLVKRLSIEFDISPQNIIFELTETAIIIDIKNTVHILNELKDLGFRIFVDDFGTGYSSLSLIRKLPIAGLKIDKLFVQGIEKNHDDLNLVKSIFTLAKNMQLTVIAEGVENEQQLLLIQHYPYAKAQGFLLGKPIPLEDAKKLSV